MIAQVWRPKDAAYIALASPDCILAHCEELERKTAALERLVTTVEMFFDPA